MKHADPFSYWINAIQAGLVMAEAQVVINIRVMGMAGIWSVTPAEDGRMISEKMQAMTRALTDAGNVVLRGGLPDQITAAVTKPIRQKTRANAKRLLKRGFKRI